jgi:integrase
VRPKSRAFKIWDAQGLHLFVAPSGLRAWRVRIRADRREAVISLGQWPDVALGQARDAAAQARAMMVRGLSPKDVATKLADQRAGSTITFEQVAREWHADRLERWTADHASDVLASLERHIFPTIGDELASAVTTQELLRVLGQIGRIGALATARRIAQRIGAIYRYAVFRNMVESNPAAGLVSELKAARPVQPQLALEDLDEARALLEATDRARVAPAIRLASRFLALTAVRLAAVRGAQWAEIEGVDWSTDAPAPDALWRVPAERMKLALAKKGDDANDHLVPLSPAALSVLRQARGLGDTGLIFHKKGRAIGKNAIGELYDRCGFAGRHVPHGWRATFSTILNEQFPGDGMMIERALAHTEKNVVKAAYDRAKHLPRLRFLFDQWGDMIAPDASAGDRPE